MSNPHPDIPALLAEADELPDPQKSLLTHNERVLIEFCQRLAAALRPCDHYDRLGEATKGLMP